VAAPSGPCTSVSGHPIDAGLVLASCLGRLRHAACKRLLDDLWCSQLWITTFLELDRTQLTLRRSLRWCAAR
jgi:hypothetical protein